MDGLGNILQEALAKSENFAKEKAKEKPIVTDLHLPQLPTHESKDESDNTHKNETKTREQTGEHEDVHADDHEDVQNGEQAENVPRGTLGDFVNPALAVTITDILFSRLIPAIGGSIGYDLGDRKTWKLDLDEKTALKKEFKNCLDTIPFEMESPWGRLGLVMLAIYGGKVATGLIDRPQSEKKETAFSKKNTSSETRGRKKALRDENGNIVRDEQGKPVTE